MSEQSANEQTPNHVPGQPLPSGGALEKSPARPRRRWGRRIGLALIVVFALLAALIAAAPYLISTTAGSHFALSLVNRRIHGVLQLQSLSLSWSGPTTLQGLRVLDPAQREVLKVDRVTAAPGVWGLITGPLDFNEIGISAARAVLYVNRDNEVSLLAAFEPRQPSPLRTRPSPLPEPRGRIVIQGATVRVVRENGPSYEVADLGGEIQLQTLSNLSGKLHGTFPEGAKLTTEADVRNLVAEGTLAPLQATGQLTVKTDGAIQLGPLTRLLVPEQAVDGALTVNVQASGTASDLQADFAIAAAQLQTAERREAHAAPVDLQVKGQASRKGDTIAAQADLAGEAGTARTKLTYRVAQQPVSVSADQVLSAVLTGKRVDLPDFSVDVQGQLDLARLQKAVPNLLKVRAGQEITAGTLEVSQVSIQGGAEPSASGGIELKDITAVSDGRTARLAPISLGFDVALRSGSGLQIDRAELKSSFAAVQAKGSVSDLQATCRSNLGKLQEELGQVFDLSRFDLNGELASELRLSRASDERVDVSLDATVNSLRLGSHDKRFDLARLTLRQAGFLTLADRAVTRFDVSSADADLDGQVLLAATGWYDLQKHAFRGDANVKHADLGFLASRADALGLSELSRYGGTLALQTTAERTAGDQPITANGNLTAQNLAVDGQPLVEGDAKLAWTHVQVVPETSRVEADAVRLESAPANLDVQHVRWQGSQTLDLSADVKVSADLARLMRVIGAVAKMEKPPAIAGTLALDSRLATAKQVVTVAARGGVDELAVGAGEQTIREKRLDFDADGKLEQQRDKLTLTRLKLTAAPLSAEISGSVARYSTDRVLALQGHYDASWEQLTALLHELVPATAQTVIVKGKSTSEFKITGPLHEPDAQPPFRGLKSGLEIGWASAELYGVDLGAAKLSPTLAKGKVTLPRTAIPATGGKVNVAGVIDFAPPEPTLNIAGKLRVLDNVPLTPQVATSLLSWISPVFLHVARIEGRVNLQAADVRLPLSAAIKTSGDAQGVLDLQKVKLAPAGLLGELAGLAGHTRQEPAPVTFGKLAFVIKDGRVRYDDLTLTFPGSFDLKFHGSVGFDSTLDLVVSIPVRGPLLERLGMKGPALEAVEQFSDLRVDVPLVGTREHPQLDLSKVDKEKLLKQLVVPAKPEKAIEDLLKKAPVGGKEGQGGRRGK